MSLTSLLYWTPQFMRSPAVNDKTCITISSTCAYLLCLMQCRPRWIWRNRRCYNSQLMWIWSMRNAVMLWSLEVEMSSSRRWWWSALTKSFVRRTRWCSRCPWMCRKWWSPPRRPVISAHNFFPFRQCVWVRLFRIMQRLLELGAYE